MLQLNPVNILCLVLLCGSIFETRVAGEVLTKRNCYESKTCYDCLNSEDPRVSSDGTPFGRCIPMAWGPDDQPPNGVGRNLCEPEYVVNQHNLENNRMLECILPEPYDIDDALEDDEDEDEDNLSKMKDDRFFIIRRDFSKSPINDERLSHSGLLLRINLEHWIVEYLDDGQVHLERAKSVCEDTKYDFCEIFLHNGYRWHKQKFGKKIPEKVTPQYVAEQMEHLMSYSKFRLENHNSIVAQESLRLKLKWSSKEELTYQYQAQFNLKALNLEKKPCYMIKKCTDCTKYLDSRKNEWPGQCLPVKNTKNVCEPESYIQAKQLSIQSECIHSDL